MDALKCGFAIYSLKCASLFSFRLKSEAEESNLGSVYQIENIPKDSGLRQILDGVPSMDIRKGFHALFKRIRRIGILDEFRFWGKHFILSIDGVEHFCSKNVGCPHCMQRNHRNGEVSNYHSMLSAVIVHPEKKQVLVLDNEPIIKQDGAKKNDCECNAAKRLFAHLKSLYAKEYIIFVLDALYACGPIIRQLNKNDRWKFVINVKPDGNKSLFRQFEGREKRKHVKHYEIEDEKGSHSFKYTNNLALNSSSSDVRVNMLYYEWTDLKGKKKVFSWCTNIKLNKSNVHKVMKAGRSRWKIENETFNTLKNQEYNFEHNFGHGQQNLCTNFVFLMMLAFCVDQIQESSCQFFQKILKTLKTRIKFWEAIRTVFQMLVCKNMKEVFGHIAKMYRVQLE